MDDLFDQQADAKPLFAGKYPQRAHPGGHGHLIEVPDGELLYAPRYFSRKISDRAFELLLANDRYPALATDWRTADLAGIRWQTSHWRQDRINIFGRSVALPRLTAWHGDDDRPYTFSGLTLQPQPWNKMLAWLRDQLQALTGVRFNSVLLNWYRDGGDHISWHADDEPELGTNPTIASVNFGASRRFLLRRADDHQEKIELPLAHGSLLIMSGALQHHWQHSVPKQKKVAASRINMTFRHIQPPS